MPLLKQSDDRVIKLEIFPEPAFSILALLSFEILSQNVPIQNRIITAEAPRAQRGNVLFGGEDAAKRKPTLHYLPLQKGFDKGAKM